MAPSGLAGLLREAAAAVGEALSRTDDWGLTEGLPGQHKSDLAADEAALAVLSREGIDVLSEESGITGPGTSGLMAVLDPLDGSTNAAQGLPWYATSICLLDDEGPLVALVKNQASQVCYEAERRGGARRDGEVIRPSAAMRRRESIIGVNGYPPAYLGWRQYRALGAVSLDLCSVAEGALDGYVDCSRDGHGAWDYMGALLVCSEAGAHLVEANGEELVVRQHSARRYLVAGGSAALCGELLAARTAAFAASRDPG